VTAERGRYVVLGTATAANLAQFGARVVVSPFVIAIAASYAVSKGEVGIALTGMWAAFALLQFPSGVLADKYGERRVMALSMGLTAVGSALVVVAPSFPLFALAVVALGAGAGLYFAVGTALLARRFDDGGQGRAFGVHSAGGPLAGLALPVVATAVAARYDWRAGIAVGTAVAVGAFALVLVAVGPTPPASPGLDLRRQLHPRNAFALLSRPGVAYTTAIATLGMYVFQSFVSFFPTFLREYHGFETGEASLAFGVAFGLVAVGLPLVGSLADAHGTTAALVAPFLVTASGFGVLVAASGNLPVYAGIGLVGAGITWAGPLQSRFMAAFDAETRASGFGVVRTVFVLLGSVGNVATGALAEIAGWPVAYGVVGGFALLAAGLVGVRTLE